VSDSNETHLAAFIQHQIDLIMIRVSVQEAKEKLEVLIEKALAGERVEIISDGTTANLSVQKSSKPIGNRLGSQKGVLIYMSDDFNEPLDDFKEYME
jgi:antitoxin (DNA-binding transcriptional repressor) of toxin-antitoxin stability system